MSVLSCPRCGLTVPVSQHQNDVEHCPRCLARSRGTMSVSLDSELPSTDAHGGGIIGRLIGEGNRGR
jgi:hypothetical protein